MPIELHAFDTPNGRKISDFESGAILIDPGEKTGSFRPPDLEARISVLQWLTFQQGGSGRSPGRSTIS